MDILYEDKIRNKIMYLVDKIGWPTFYEKLLKLMNIWNELKNNEASLKPIVKNGIIGTWMSSVISLSCEQIGKTFDMTNELSISYDKRITL